MVKWSEKEAAVRKLERYGKVDPADLIEAARDPSHPCHGDFTWDIEQAAKERWHDQARAIIRQCKFSVKVEEITTPVVMYVSSPDDDGMFVSLPKTRGQSRCSMILLTEIRMLHGLVARVVGVALAKQNIVGRAIVAQLEAMRDQLAVMKAEMEGE